MKLDKGFGSLKEEARKLNQMDAQIANTVLFRKRTPESEALISKVNKWLVAYLTADVPEHKPFISNSNKFFKYIQIATRFGDSRHAFSRDGTREIWRLCDVRATVAALDEKGEIIPDKFVRLGFVVERSKTDSEPGWQIRYQPVSISEKYAAGQYWLPKSFTDTQLEASQEKDSVKRSNVWATRWHPYTEAVHHLVKIATEILDNNLNIFFFQNALARNEEEEARLLTPIQGFDKHQEVYVEITPYKIKLIEDKNAILHQNGLSADGEEDGAIFDSSN